MTKTEQLTMTENKKRILKRAAKLAKRRYRSEQYRRYFHQYNNLETTTTEQFDKKVLGEEPTTNVVEMKPYTKKVVQPAMPVATHLYLYKKRLMNAYG